ncbi:PREDICTED: pentatricopeptide repeat-containing protein At3g53170 isoform X2 [Nelumbo nucifera]|uniref:Pentatricopeptide repeat-containing protein At3g53170 isoform X2 n=1 Tax=Nelumbo nucifera TaxID=4432 RepID=A0A1U8BK24_NELNU|nr:PREDICTED: pentatricopeptide repeat-containing protein At3g53170 isoform X2 [Nelumbo nucifera]
MELQFPDVSQLRFSSSCSFLTFFVSSDTPRRPAKKAKPPFLLVNSEKRNSDALKGLQKEANKDLSRILRTEAAVKGIEKKANSKTARNLWPKAVLEALDDAIRNNQWESALKIFGLLRKQHWYQPRCQTYTKLLMMLGKCRQPKQASLLFEFMLSEGLKPTVDVYTSLVSAYGLSGLLDEAFRTLDDMKSVSDCKPDVYTYSILIKCCTKLHRFDLIDHILTEMSYLGIRCCTVTYNTIIDGYGKAEMFELMESSLMDMIENSECLPDIYTLNSFIWAYGNAGQIEKMEEWYDEFQHMGITPDIKTFNILIRSYGKAGMYEKMGMVLEFMRKRFFSPTIVTFNIVIEMFGKGGNIKQMEHFFQVMKHQGLKPNSITYCSLISGYTKAGLIKRVDSIMRQVENSDVVLDTPFFNCAINAYGQSGDVKKMEEIFLTMKERKCKPDSITFATMIEVYNAHGKAKASQKLEMQLYDRNKNSDMEGQESRSQKPNMTWTLEMDNYLIEALVQQVHLGNKIDKLRALLSWNDQTHTIDVEPEVWNSYVEITLMMIVRLPHPQMTLMMKLEILHYDQEQ